MDAFPDRAQVAIHQSIEASFLTRQSHLDQRFVVKGIQCGILNSRCHLSAERMELFPTTRTPARSSSAKTVTQPANGTDFRMEREQHGTQCRAKLSGKISIDS